MMPRSPQEALRELDRKMVRVSIIDSLGVIALAIGLFARYSDNPASLHPLLGDPTVALGLMVVGGAIAAWGALQVLSIARQRARIQEKLDT